MLAAYDAEVRTALPTRLPSGITVDWDGPLQRWTGDHRGFVTYRDLDGLDGDELEALIQRTVAHYRARGEAFEWKTHGHDRPADLGDRLVAAGFVAEEPETVLVGRAEALAVESHMPECVTLRAVTERADLERIATMEDEVWGEAKVRSHLADSLAARIDADPDEITVLVAEAGGKVVSAAWLVVNPGTSFAGLWGGATLAAWRGRGIYRALVARRARLAVAWGVEHLQVDASEESRPILQRLGFTAITTTTPYLWTP